MHQLDLFEVALAPATTPLETPRLRTRTAFFSRLSKKSEKSEKKFQPTLETRFWEVCNTSFKGRSSWKKGIAGPIRTRWDPSLAAKRGGRCAACSRATRKLGDSMWPSPKPTAIQRHPSKFGCAGFDASARGATLGACGGLTRFRTSHPASTGQTEHPAKAPTHPTPWTTQRTLLAANCSPRKPVPTLQGQVARRSA